MAKFSYYLKINDSLQREILYEQDKLEAGMITNSQLTINMSKHFSRFMNNNELQIIVVYKPNEDINK